MTYMHAGWILIDGIASPDHDTEMEVPIVTLTSLDKGGMQIDLMPDGARSMARRLMRPRTNAGHDAAGQGRRSAPRFRRLNLLMLYDQVRILDQ